MAVAGGSGVAIPRGFTLVEVLVVLIVIALGAGLVTLSMGHDSAAILRQESERLRSSLEYAAQLAQWRRTPLAWEADEQGYRFLLPGADGAWVEESDATLARHAFPQTLRMQVQVMGPAGEPASPLLLLRASGRNDPYTLVLQSAAGRWLVQADPLNRVRAEVAP